MPLDVLGCTRATLMRSTSLQPWLIGLGNLLNAHRARDRLLQLLILNEEFLVNASHQLALITSLPFVHTARRTYRLKSLVKNRDCSVVLYWTLPWEPFWTLFFRGRWSRNKVSVGEPAEGSLSHQISDLNSREQAVHGCNVSFMAHCSWYLWLFYKKTRGESLRRSTSVPRRPIPNKTINWIQNKDVSGLMLLRR